MNTFLDIKIGRWSLLVLKGEWIARHQPSKLPRTPAIYVLNLKQVNYVGQSIDAYRRVRHHIRKRHQQNNGAGTATLILNREEEVNEALLVHIEFGLMLIHLGCDRQLVSKQTELPLGSKAVRRRALEFFEEFAARFFVAAPHLIGSCSRRNQRAMGEVLPYLRMIWADR